VDAGDQGGSGWVAGRGVSCWRESELLKEVRCIGRGVKALWVEFFAWLPGKIVELNGVWALMWLVATPGAQTTCRWLEFRMRVLQNTNEVCAPARMPPLPYAPAARVISNTVLTVGPALHPGGPTAVDPTHS
jgi:hypothetical protein